MFPWRETTDPYRILVSEVMLQQTQTERVVIKYQEFLKQFPKVTSLAKAPLGDVLRAWSGLGYNRRAKMLHACAKAIVTLHKGVFPKTYEGLVSLPGVGPYTAGAVLAFAFNTPIPIIETNIRTVYLHHFFPKAKAVSDALLMPLIEATLDKKNPRVWYAQLMDYGAWIKKTHGNQNTRSRSYVKQSKFKGSLREVRGAILRALAKKGYTKEKLRAGIECSKEQMDLALMSLLKEGMVVEKKGAYRLP